MCKSVFLNLLRNYFFWVLLVLLLGIDVYSITDKAGRRNDEMAGHETVYAEFKGALSKDKIRTVVSRYQELGEIVGNDDYSHEGGQPGTYTGYFAGDYGEFQEIFEEYKYRYEYASYAKGIMGKAAATDRIRQSFAGRKLDSYYDMEGPQELLEHDLYTLLCAAFTIFCACKIVVYDKKQNIYILLETCSLGMRKVMARKIFSLMLLVFLLVAVFSITNMAVFSRFYDLEGIHEPLYAMREYKNTLFRGSIFQFWLIQALGVWIGCVLIGVVCMFFAAMLREELYAVLLGVLLYVGFTTLFFRMICWANPVGLMAGFHLIRDMDLYWYVFATVSGITVLCSGGLVWISGSYQISDHS